MNSSDQSAHYFKLHCPTNLNGTPAVTASAAAAAAGIDPQDDFEDEIPMMWLITSPRGLTISSQSKGVICAKWSGACILINIDCPAFANFSICGILFIFISSIMIIIMIVHYQYGR